ncbi:hypothetical protein Avbf_05633 [Armadillidium vulgare]|nr:hypothetical protein Avbf_05633 [Armadillidium vulgare]
MEKFSIKLYICLLLFISIIVGGFTVCRTQFSTHISLGTGGRVYFVITTVYTIVKLENVHSL